MTARQQIIRLLPLLLLVVLVFAGLRGAVPAPGWTGPLKSWGIPIAAAVEVIFAALLIAIRVREAMAKRATERAPYSGEDQEIEPAEALRFTLRYVLIVCMIALGALLIANLHLHFFAKSKSLAPKIPRIKTSNQSTQASGHAITLHIPWGPILYGLLVVALVAAVVVSIWWSSRLRRPAAPLVIEDVDTEQLREAVAEGRAALADIDDARAAIIACYVAMERSLADQGTARHTADTPDELLARAVAAGTVRGTAAGRLTDLFYEARFSTHPMTSGKRDAARAALDELSAELAVRTRAVAEQKAAAEAERARQEARLQAAQAAQGQPPASEATGESARPGGGWV